MVEVLLLFLIQILHDFIIPISNMKKVQIQQQERPDRMEREESEFSSQMADEPQELNYIPRMKRKQAILLTYRGIIQSGNVHINHSLNILYTTVIAENWKLSYGQKSGISQSAFHNGNQFVWNFPFEMTLETANPQNWPQLVFIVNGKDFFGRSVAKGYGNIHLPSSEGTHKRKVRLFETIPPSNTASCCAFIQGYMNELKQPQKVLTSQDRSFVQTKLIGDLTLKMQVRRYNFDNFGYD